MSALFSTFGIDWHLLLAQTANFVILAVLLSWLLYKPVLKMVRERQALVAKGVEDAEAAKEELRLADGKAKVQIQSAEQKAEELVEHARKAAEETKIATLREAEKRAKEIEKDAQLRAEELKARSAKESEKEVARLAILAAEKILRK